MSVLGGSGMTRVSEQANTGSNQGGRIVWEGPPSASVSPPATFNGQPLDSASVTVQGGKKIITAVYNAATGEVNSERTVLRASDGAGQEVPIESHPLYDPSASAEQGVPVVNGEPKFGLETFQVPGIVYRRTQYFSSFSFTESNLTSNVGTRNAPAGISGASANNWLKIGIDVQEQSTGAAVVTETWLWAKDGWDPDVYG